MFSRYLGSAATEVRVPDVEWEVTVKDRGREGPQSVCPYPLVRVTRLLGPLSAECGRHLVGLLVPTGRSVHGIGGLYTWHTSKLMGDVWPECAPELAEAAVLGVS